MTYLDLKGFYTADQSADTNCLTSNPSINC